MFSSAAKKAEDAANQSRHLAALPIQCMVRKFLAKRRVKHRAARTWQRVFDPKFRIFFWFNKLNGQSQWTKPKLVDLYSEEDRQATLCIERVVRGFLGRRRGRRIVHSRFTRFYDSNANKFYWMENATQKTTWKVSKWMIRQDVPMPVEDQMLYTSAMKIKELEEKLLAKDKEIKEVRKARYEELEPLVIADRVGKAKSLKRSRNMDEWSIDDLAAWFTELKMEEYIPFIFKNRVDGNLFINLAEEDWEDMGIINKFHIRKLQIILKSFRVRYQRKKDRIEVDEDDDLLSEYSPSELSDIIEAEGRPSDDEEDDVGEEDQIVQKGYEEEEVVHLSEEQLQERKMDSKNINIEMLVVGDGKNFPMIGDIVRVRYVCTVVATGKLVTSTKNGMQLQSVEFVLGIGQVIKGFDRAVPQMSIGERSKITITSEYAYGKEGLAPHIPADAEVCFDLTLLGFRPRPSWVKPLIQELGLFMKPFEVDKQHQAEQGVQLNDDDDSITAASNFKGSSSNKSGPSQTDRKTSKR